MKFGFKTSMKAFSLSAALILLLSVVLSACGSSKESAASPSASATPSGPVKLTVAVRANPNNQDLETNGLTKKIEQMNNVDLDFVVLPSKLEDAIAKLQLMVSSGEKLPDVINMSGIDDAIVFDYATKGIFVKLDDYYKKADLTPNLSKLPQKDRDSIINGSKMPDGKIYTVPSYSPLLWNEGAYRSWINSAWLEKLNLKAPTTTDELVTVLKAFAEKDPNGNGKKDEIGIVGNQQGWATSVIPTIMNAFIFANPDKGYFTVNNGKVIPAFTQPEWKQGLEFMNQLVKDGLLSKLSFTQDNTQMKALINVKGGMAGIVTGGSYSNFINTELLNKMVLLNPLKGPKGVSYATYNPITPVSSWFVTKDSKTPDIAFKVGQTFFDPEIALINRYGEKGVDFSNDPAVLDKYDFGGAKPGVAILNTQYWNNPQNKGWQTWSPHFLDGNLINESAVSKEKVDPLAPPNFRPQFNEVYPKSFPKEFITRLPYTADEMKKISEPKTLIGKYVVDTAIEFIVGNKPLSQWDSYLAELDKMGLPSLVAANQAAYDRSK